MADSKYNRTLSKEEIDILREETNNFATNFSKINLTETVKNIITRSYNEANNQDVADDTDLYSIVSNFASDTIDDSIASHALVFGQKLNPENYMESLVSICYTASKKEAEERYERFRLRFEAGDIPDSTEDYNTFMKEVKRTFTGYNLSKKFYKDFKENLNALALEENDIIETVKEALIENVEETEKKQKLIHDIIEEVNDVKSKYAEKAEPEDSSTTNDEIEAESNSGDNDVNFGEDVDTPPSDLNSENYKKMFGKENAENDVDDSDDDETSAESDEPDENDTTDTDNEGLGVAATYQNEDPFGTCSAKFALNIYEEDFNTQGYPTLSKEINSIESALKSIFEDVFKNTYGSKESIKNLNKIKSVEYNKIFDQIKEQIFNKMTTPMKAMENVVIFKEFLENKSYVQSKENFDLSGRRIPLYFPKSEDIMKAISQLAKIERNKLPEAYESFDTLMLTRMDHFFKKGVKNFIFAHDSRESQINLIQLWKFKNGSRVRSEENYRDFYDMMDLSYEDLPSITSVDEIDDINASKPDNVTDVDTKPLDESAMNEVDTLFQTKPDDKYGDVKIVNPNRGSENDEGNEDDTSEEAISLRLDEYEKEHLAKIKTEIDRCCNEAPKILRETFDQVFTPKVIGNFNKEIMKRNKKKNDDVKLVEKEDVWNYLKKNTIFVDKSTLYGKLEKYKKFYTTSGMLKRMTTRKSDKNQAFEFMIVPSMNKLRSELAKGGKKLNENELLEDNTPSFLFHLFLGGAIPVLILFFFTYLKGFKNTLRKNLKKKLDGTYINVDDAPDGIWNRTTAGDTKLDNFKSQMWGGGNASYYIILDYKFKGKESFELFFNNKALESAFIPKSLLKFERTPLITPESLSLIFMRKSVEEYNDLKQMFNEGLEHLETIAKRDNNEMALKKVGAWRENLEKGIELFKMKNSAIARLGLCSYNIIDNKRDDVKTQYVAKNIINRGYLLPYYQQKLPNITTENYENSFENIVDRIFDLSIRKRKWESIYPDAVTAREDMEMREEKLEENLMEYSPDEKNFAKALKDTLVFRDLDKFFTFDSMLLDYKSIFYKYVEQEQIKDIIDGAGFRNQVIKGLESRRGYLDENDIYFVDKYLDGMHIENINMTRYEQFAAKLIRDRRNENLDNNVYTAVFTPRSSESIRNEAKLYLSCELTRRALGLETEKNLRETNLFLNE